MLRAGSGYAHRTLLLRFHTDMQRFHIQLAEEHAMKAAFLKGDRGEGLT